MVSTLISLRPRGGELLAQPLRDLQLEGERRGIHRRAVEVRPHGLDGGHEEPEELDLVRVAVGDHQHAAAGLDDARHLADALRHVGKQHDAELRSGHVEAVVVERERVAVHDAGLDVEPLVARPLRAAARASRATGRSPAPARRGGPRGWRARRCRPPRRGTACPRRSPARRRPSFPSHICVGVLVLS